jgi:prepilin-type N-terminal cleavage/methylation domain-containing protein
MKTKKGFTLVELMVVVGILSIIMLVISQPVASVIKYQRESQTSDNMRDNLQFVINKMEKELKTASIVYVVDSSNLKFINQDGALIIYKFDQTNKKILRNDADLTDPNLFNVVEVLFAKNVTPNRLVTIFIKSNSADGKDTVSMQSSILPVNDIIFASTTKTNINYWEVASNVSNIDLPNNTSASSFLNGNNTFYSVANVTARDGWIANNNTGNNDAKWTQFVFRQKLDLSNIPDSQINKLRLKFRWAADDSGSGGVQGSWVPKYTVNDGVLNNGVWNPTNNTYTLGAETIISNLIKGVNTIDFYVQGNGTTDGMSLESLGFTIDDSPPIVVKDGSSPAKAAPSAKYLVEKGFTSNGVYWIDLPVVGPTKVYSILDPIYDGGGWMMMMKATQGTTFGYDSNHWTTDTVLNPNDTTRNDADAKFNTMNYFKAQDMMAIWPDIQNGGSINASQLGWTWLEKNFNGAGDSNKIAPIDFFNKTYPMTPFGSGKFIMDAKTFSGWQNGIFSSQPDIQFYGFNYISHPNVSLDSVSHGKVRWGFGWNENGEGLYSLQPIPATGIPIGSNDVSGGIGMGGVWPIGNTWSPMPGSGVNYSAGDGIYCCQDSTGINRPARVEVYIR